MNPQQMAIMQQQRMRAQQMGQPMQQQQPQQQHMMVTQVQGGPIQQLQQHVRMPMQPQGQPGQVQGQMQNPVGQMTQNQMAISSDARAWRSNSRHCYEYASATTGHDYIGTRAYA